MGYQILDTVTPSKSQSGLFPFMVSVSIPRRYAFGQMEATEIDLRIASK